MTSADRRGFEFANDLIGQVCLLPWASIYSLAVDLHQSLVARNYAYINPSEQFIDAFVRQFSRSEHRIDAVA